MHVTLSNALTVLFVFEWVIRIGALFVVPHNRKPTAATGWLMLIMIEPILGLAVFLLIGSPRLNKKRRQMQRMMDEVIKAAVEEAVANPEYRDFVQFDVPERYKPIVALNYELGGMPAFTGNKVELIPEYGDVFVSIARDIHAAKQSVLIEFFIFTYDDETAEIFEAIGEATKRGVKVMVLMDALGSGKLPNHRLTKRKLTELGVEWRKMLPLQWPGSSFNRPDLRNHRKLIVIDGTIGYTGSLNIIKRNYHRKDALYYDELMVRMQGPIVTQLHGAFITDWYSETGVLLSREANDEITLKFERAGNTLAQVLPSGPGFENENNLKLFTSLIHAATQRIIIVNPYFVPDESLFVAITSAAQRGVEVIMINSEIMDQKMVGHAQRSYYEGLLAAGVRIYLYDYPVLLHSKFLTIDNDMAVIGSSNLDLRSFQLDLEVSLVVYDSDVVTELQKLQNVYLSKSKEITPEQWHKRSKINLLLDNLARLTASLQ